MFSMIYSWGRMRDPKESGKGLRYSAEGVKLPGLQEYRRSRQKGKTELPGEDAWLCKWPLPGTYRLREGLLQAWKTVLVSNLTWGRTDRGSERQKGLGNLQKSSFESSELSQAMHWGSGQKSSMWHSVHTCVTPKQRVPPVHFDEQVSQFN